MWIGKYLKGNFHDTFDIIYPLQQILYDAFMTQYEVLYVLEQM
jgi:hypothetical protein